MSFASAMWPSQYATTGTATAAPDATAATPADTAKTAPSYAPQQEDPYSWIYGDFNAGLSHLQQVGKYSGGATNYGQGINPNWSDDIANDAEYQKYLATGKDTAIADPRSAAKWQEVSNIPKSFSSVDEMLAYKGKGNSSDMATTGFNSIDKDVFAHVSYLPKDVQEAIAKDPRRFAAGQLGLLADRNAPEKGMQYASYVGTPSGRWLSFEDKMGGYNTQWANSAKWNPINGLEISDQAVFVPHQKKTTFLDKAAPAMIIGAATGGIGSAIGAAGAAAAGASTTTGAIIGQAIASGLVTKAQGGSFGDVLTSMGTSVAGSYVGGKVGGAIKDTGAVSGTTAKIIGGATGAATTAGLSTAIKGGSFGDVLTNAAYAGGSGAISGAVNAGVTSATGSSDAGKVAGSVTGGIINTAKPVILGQTSTPTPAPTNTQTTTTGKTPVSIQSLNWRWLTPSVT